MLFAGLLPLGQIPQNPGSYDGNSPQDEIARKLGENMRVQNTATGHGEGRGRIHLLPDTTVDQIAAGEVVERPASVVKELVENSLDAEAERIRVEVREGGAALISVTDDGHGMTPDDARMALQRHATSKLRTSADLSCITSFGFRGEALPAIASVSRMRLLTRLRGTEQGHEVRAEAGKIGLERTAGAPEGTRIEVADLFGNVPARRKFLKKPITEWGHIADWLGRLALALPAVHFEVQREQKKPLIWPATTSALDRIAAVLSEEEAAALLAVELEEGAAHLQAFVSAPDRTRASAGGLYLFVNGRPVRDRLLRHAVLDAYRDLLPRGRYPSAVLFLAVPPTDVDVNVHPAKWEIRFADPRAIHQLVKHAVRDAMAGRAWLGSARSAPRGHREGPERGAADIVAERGDWAFAPGRPMAAPPAISRDTASQLLPQPGRPHGGDANGRLEFASLRLLGQMLASYLVLEGPQGMLLVDQHAAHERVLYERLRSSWLERGVERQGLLMPTTVELEPLTVGALVEAAATVERLGFELAPFAENTVVVRAVPALLSDSDPVGLVQSLAQEIESSGVEPEGSPDQTRLLRAADRALATLACHSARRFGEHLEPGEQRAILAGLDDIPWAPTCPHGRPVAVAMSNQEIERRFARR